MKTSGEIMGKLEERGNEKQILKMFMWQYWSVFLGKEQKEQ